jgi:translation initiation factor 3 subunit F
VIGALVGTRSEDGSEVEVRSTFAIPHTENEDQVEVDVEYQKNMLALTLKASPRETLLGWYTTSHELNSFSALIQNFFASPETGTFPHPAVHLTISTEPGAPIATKTYISAPVAVSPDRAAESCLFIEVPHKLLFSDAERAALGTASAAADTEARSAPVISDIETLARSLESVSDLLERVSGFVGEVLDEERDGSHALGQYLMNALSLAPKVSATQIEADFNNHVQDVLMVSYLANTIRTQIDLAQRLATAPLVGGDKEGGDKGGGKDGEEGGRGGRGGKRGGGRGGGGHRGEPREPREPREPAE